VEQDIVLGVVLDGFGMGHTSARENRCKNDPMDLVCPLVIMFISFTNGFPLSLGRKRLVVASTWTSLLGCPETYQAASLPRQPDDRVGSVWFGVLMRNARTSKSAKCAKTNGDPGAIRTRDPQLRRFTREILKSVTNSYTYNTFQVRLVPAGDGLSRLEGGERRAHSKFIAS
jgi:hypothetical protein